MLTATGFAMPTWLGTGEESLQIENSELVAKPAVTMFRPNVNK